MGTVVEGVGQVGDVAAATLAPPRGAEKPGSFVELNGIEPSAS